MTVPGRLLGHSSRRAFIFSQVSARWTRLRKGWPMLVLALIFVPTYRLLFALLPFPGVRRADAWLARRAAGTVGLVRDFDEDAAAWAIDAVGHRIGASCLVRAFAGRRLARGFGLQPTLMLGVKGSRERLDAHAWLEMRGQPFLSQPERLHGYRPFV